jgi:hypothetical protein
MDMFILCIIMSEVNVCIHSNGEYVVFILCKEVPVLNVEMADECSNLGDRFAY